MNVEKSAWHTVDRVLAVTVPEQHASHRDLGELQRKESCRVIERQTHFRATERGALCGAGKDDVVHLLTSHRFWCLRAEHPRHCVNDV